MVLSVAPAVPDGRSMRPMTEELFVASIAGVAAPCGAIVGRIFAVEAPDRRTAVLAAGYCGAGAGLVSAIPFAFPPGSDREMVDLQPRPCRSLRGCGGGRYGPVVGRCRRRRRRPPRRHRRGALQAEPAGRTRHADLTASPRAGPAPGRCPLARRRRAGQGGVATGEPTVIRGLPAAADISRSSPKGAARHHLARRRLSSAVEQRFCKPKVGGSIPSAGTNDFNGLDDFWSKFHVTSTRKHYLTISSTSRL